VVPSQEGSVIDLGGFSSNTLARGVAVHDELRDHLCRCRKEKQYNISEALPAKQ